MTHDLIEKSKKHLWLPFTQMKDYDENPLIIESGTGIKVQDINGRNTMTVFHQFGLMSTDTAKKN